MASPEQDHPARPRPRWASGPAQGWLPGHAPPKRGYALRQRHDRSERTAYPRSCATLIPAARMRPVTGPPALHGTIPR